MRPESRTMANGIGPSQLIIPCGQSPLSRMTEIHDIAGMNYWTLFTLRMMARVGLLASVCMWAMGQYQDDPPRYVPFVMESSLFTDADGVGAVWPIGFHHSDWDSISADHWLICLTFFIATILTSVRWRKWAAESAEEQTFVQNR